MKPSHSKIKLTCTPCTFEAAAISGAFNVMTWSGHSSSHFSVGQELEIHMLSVSTPHCCGNRVVNRSTSVNHGEGNFMVLSLRDSQQLCGEGSQENLRQLAITLQIGCTETRARDLRVEWKSAVALSEQGGASTPTAREGKKAFTA